MLEDDAVDKQHLMPERARSRKPREIVVERRHYD